jgi:hypothetical protein
MTDRIFDAIDYVLRYIDYTFFRTPERVPVRKSKREILDSIKQVNEGK